jgi:hypothetical protein
MKATEQDINKRLEEIDDTISALQAEKRALTGLLHMKVAEQHQGGIPSKRSYKRIYNEEKIKGAIDFAGKNARTQVVYKILKMNGVNIKESTLRSHLTRLKEKGDIVRVESVGIWKRLHRDNKRAPD